MIDNGSTAYNRAYMASCLRHSTPIPLRGTSGTLVTLYEIALQYTWRLSK